MAKPPWQDRLKLRMFRLLPQLLLTRVVFWLARLETRLKNLFIRLFIRAYKVNLAEAEHTDLNAYPSFNAFFTRALKPGARSWVADAHTIGAPCDGVLGAFGVIREGRLIQAKGQTYTLAALLGDAALGQAFQQGQFCTLYLAPRDYHRVHMPVTGTLQQMIYVPGRLWTVAEFAVRNIPNLFDRNERVISVFDTPFGRMALVLVGAINVAAIETSWAGLVTPPRGGAISMTNYPQADHPIVLKRGEEMGRFNLGSTVILLLATPNFAWADLASNQHIVLGHELGRFLN